MGDFILKKVKCIHICIIQLDCGDSGLKYSKVLHVYYSGLKKRINHALNIFRNAS